jgi:hypothetical protein
LVPQSLLGGGSLYLDFRALVPSIEACGAGETSLGALEADSQTFSHQRVLVSMVDRWGLLDAPLTLYLPLGK